LETIEGVQAGSREDLTLSIDEASLHKQSVDGTGCKHKVYTYAWGVNGAEHVAAIEETMADTTSAFDHSECSGLQRTELSYLTNVPNPSLKSDMFADQQRQALVSQLYEYAKTKRGEITVSGAASMGSRKKDRGNCSTM
jgi:hypothetical protein